MVRRLPYSALTQFGQYSSLMRVGYVLATNSPPHAVRPVLMPMIYMLPQMSHWQHRVSLGHTFQQKQ